MFSQVPMAAHTVCTTGWGCDRACLARTRPWVLSPSLKEVVKTIRLSVGQEQGLLCLCGYVHAVIVFTGACGAIGLCSKESVSVKGLCPPGLEDRVLSLCRQ